MAAAIDEEKKFDTPTNGTKPHRRRHDFGLAPTEVEDLRFFFDGAEGSFGVRSSQGALEDELLRRCPSEAARDEVAKENRLRAVRRRRPKKTVLSEGFGSLYEVLGMRAPLTHDEEDEVPIWAAPYQAGSDDANHAGGGGDIDLHEAFRARHTRERLILVGNNWTGVLFAAYGPRAAQWAKDGRGNPTHPATWFGAHLAEIAATILAYENYCAGDRVDARAQLWSYASGGALAVGLRDRARDLHNSAVAAYRLTRCTYPCRRC